MSTREEENQSPPAFSAQVLITADEIDAAVLQLAREKFRAQGYRLKQAELERVAKLVPHAPPQGVLVGIEKRRA